LRISLEETPIGVKFLHGEEMPNDYSVVKNPAVRSYCDAIRLLRDIKEHKGIIITLDSIKICKRCPTILGLKTDDKINKKLMVKIGDSIIGVFVFNINTPTMNHPLSYAINNPDVVLIVGTQSCFTDIIDVLGIENFTDKHINMLETSALSLFSKTKNVSNDTKNKRPRNMRNFNFLKRIFPFKLITRNQATIAVSSLCLNCSVIPFLSQKGNVSYFCSGGLSWGGYTEKNLVMGLPDVLYKRLEPMLEFY
jgi:uncharacterized protein (DUF169 family)